MALQGGRSSSAEGPGDGGHALAALFSPIRIKQCLVPNRIVSTPHGKRFGERNLPTERDAAYYAAKARGGTGLIVMEGVRPHWTSLPGPAALLGTLPEIVGRYRVIADRVHAHGGVIFGQVMHQGRQNTTGYSRVALWAPSAVPAPHYREIPHAMTRDEIAEMVRAYAQSAAYMREGGLDGVEIHAAHGYIIGQFLAPRTNLRVDEYGGSLDNRMRFGAEILRTVRAAIGSDCPLGIRLNGDDMIEGGATQEEMLAVMDRWLADGLLDYISISAGTHDNDAFSAMVPDCLYPAGTFVPYARAVKAAHPDVPVVAVGRVADPALANQIVAEGAADLVGMTRAIMADPDLANKAREGRAADIRPCLYCNLCMAMNFGANSITCAVNPTLGEEQRWDRTRNERAAAPRKVVVVGGGPAGMEAARVAAQRGHRVTILEAGPALGGQLALAGRLPLRAEYRSLLQWQIRQLDQLGVQVCTGMPGTVPSVQERHPDVVILATGSRPGTADFPVETGARVLNVWDLLDSKTSPLEAGAHVVLVDHDNGYQTLTLADDLVQRGHRVDLVTTKSAPGLDVSANVLPAWFKRLRKAGVTFVTGHAVGKAGPGWVDLVDVVTEDVRRLDDVQAVVTVGGHVANDELAEPLRAVGVNPVVVGDALAPRFLWQAFREGFRVGQEV